MASDEAFYCSVNASLAKNPNLERFWCLEMIGITDPVGRKSDVRLLRYFVKLSSSKMKDTRSLGLGNQIRSVHLIII